MTQTATYTVIQRDGYGTAVNSITDLNEASANDLACVLARGTAHEGDKPWTCEIVRELTPAEQAQEAAKAWRDTGTDRGGSLYKASHIAQILRGLAEDLDHLGEMDLPSTVLSVKIQVCGGWNAAAGEQIAAVDAIAHALGQTPHRYEVRMEGEPAHYGTGHGDLMVVTTAPEPEPVEAKPLVSDETIRQAEDISRMVAPLDMLLPKADCGCPIRAAGTAAEFVDHCEACEVAS